MPRESLGKEMEGRAPQEAHLAALLDESGLFTPLAPGTYFMLVDPKEGSPIPLVLKEVSVGRIVFTMDGAGTDYVYKLTGAKPLTRDAYKRLKQQGKVK